MFIPVALLVVFIQLSRARRVPKRADAVYICRLNDKPELMVALQRDLDFRLATIETNKDIAEVRSAVVAALTTSEVVIVEEIGPLIDDAFALFLSMPDLVHPPSRSLWEGEAEPVVMYYPASVWLTIVQPGLLDIWSELPQDRKHDLLSRDLVTRIREVIA